LIWGALGLSDKMSESTFSLRKLLVWVVCFSLGLCLVYSLFYLASYFGLSFFVLSNRGMAESSVGGAVVSPFWDSAVWGFGLFVVLAWLFYDLGLGMVDESYRLSTSAVLLAGLIGLSSVVGFAVTGVVSLYVLILVSLFLVVLCIGLSTELFGVSRLSWFVGLLLSLFVVLLVVEVGSLLLFSAPLVLNFGLSDVGVHWGGVELAFSNLAYPFLLYVYLLFVFLGVAAFVVKVLPEGWLISRVRFGWLVDIFRRFGSFFELPGGGLLGFFRS
jgi:hypothetical protein